MRKAIFFTLLALLVFVTGCFAAGQVNNDKKGANQVANRIAVFETNKGTFEIELFEDKVPVTTKIFKSST